jgi:hypothetical protein
LLLQTGSVLSGHQELNVAQKYSGMQDTDHLLSCTQLPVASTVTQERDVLAGQAEGTAVTDVSPASNSVVVHCREGQSASLECIAEEPPEQRRQSLAGSGDGFVVLPQGVINAPGGGSNDSSAHAFTTKVPDALPRGVIQANDDCSAPPCKDSAGMLSETILESQGRLARKDSGDAGPQMVTELQVNSAREKQQSLAVQQKLMRGLEEAVNRSRERETVLLCQMQVRLLDDGPYVVECKKSLASALLRQTMKNSQASLAYRVIGSGY